MKKLTDSQITIRWNKLERPERSDNIIINQYEYPTSIGVFRIDHVLDKDLNQLSCSLFLTDGPKHFKYKMEHEGLQEAVDHAIETLYSIMNKIKIKLEVPQWMQGKYCFTFQIDKKLDLSFERLEKMIKQLKELGSTGIDMIIYQSYDHDFGMTINGTNIKFDKIGEPEKTQPHDNRNRDLV